MPAGKLNDLTLVLTATLLTLTREYAKQLIECHGGKVTGSVSAKSNYVVAGPDPGRKLNKANEFGVPILDEQLAARTSRMP